MIVSFYDKNFEGLQNNASLVVAKDSYSLIKRPVEMNTISCVCEAFTEDIQPTFLVIQDNRGKYIYGCLAGIPLLNEKNQTEINGTDLKSMLSSDVILDQYNSLSVNNTISYIFNQWKEQVNQNSFNVELVYNDNVPTMNKEWLKTEYGENSYLDINILEKDVYNAYDEIAKYLRFYNLYIDSKIDLINKKVIFTIGVTMWKNKNLNIRLSDYGIKNYGKWVADTNECQGYYNNNGTWTDGYKWILRTNNTIFILNTVSQLPGNATKGQYFYNTTDNNYYTIDTVNNQWKVVNNPRDIYPIKRKVIINTESLDKANEESLTELLNSLYNENIELNADDILTDNATFETKFSIYLKKGQGLYKELPCGELHYNANGLTKVQIGYRYSGIEFI